MQKFNTINISNGFFSSPWAQRVVFFSQLYSETGHDSTLKSQTISSGVLSLLNGVPICQSLEKIKLLPKPCSNGRRF